MLFQTTKCRKLLGSSPQTPNDSTLRAKQKWTKTDERWVKYCVLSISSRHLQRTSSLPFHSQRQCLLWFEHKQQKTSDKWSSASGGEAPHLQGLCHSAPGTNQKWRETNVNLHEMLCLMYLCICPMASARPYPITRAFELVRSVTKLVWNGENLYVSNVKTSPASAVQGFAPRLSRTLPFEVSEMNGNKWKLAQNVVSHVGLSLGLCPMPSVFAGLCPYPIFLKDLPLYLSEAAENLC